MQFHYGAVPEDENFQPEAEGWFAIREPGPVLLQVFALPIAVVILGFLAVLLLMVLPPATFLFNAGENGIILPLWSLVAILIFLFPAHELIHAVYQPGFGLSPQTVIGVWPTRLLFYAHYEGEMSRNRFLWIFAGPFIFLSLLPIGLIGLLGQIMMLSGDMATILVVLALINGAASSGDAIGFLLVVFQIPGSAMVRNRGWRTYWKLSE